jgi:hypothetical protein
MTKEEFLLDTLEYYTEDTTRRGKEKGGACCFRSAEGKKCAIGRFIPDEKYSNDMENTPIYQLKANGIFSADIIDLPENYLVHIQNFHDSDVCWGYEKELTWQGRERLEIIITDHKLEKELFQKYLND